MKTDITSRSLAGAPPAIKTALRTADRDNTVKYVGPTAYGFKITDTPPPASTRYYEVRPDGSLYLCN